MSLIPYYPVKHARGMLIFSSDLLDDTSVELIWKMVLSTCEKWPPPSLIQRSVKIAQNYELMKL